MAENIDELEREAAPFSRIAVTSPCQSDLYCLSGLSVALSEGSQSSPSCSADDAAGDLEGAKRAAYVHKARAKKASATPTH